MRKTLGLFLLLSLSAHAGLIFDNGTGDKNDTLVIQFCLLDSTGARYTNWDTAYIVQAYGSVDFNIDTLFTATNYDLNSVYPRTLMFEYRLPAYDGTSSHTGAYTWWTLLVDNNNGTDSHQMHKGWYYVNDDPVEDFLAVNDTASSSALGKTIRDAVGDSISAIVDDILITPANKLKTDSSGYVTIGDIRNGSADSADFSVAFYRALKRYFWLDTLDLYNNDASHRQANTILKDIKSFTDGDGAGGIDLDIGDPSGDSIPTRVAWASDDSLGNGSAPPTLAAKIDSIRWAVGMPMSISGEKYSDNLHKKLGPYLGGSGDGNNIKDDIAALSLSGSGSESCTLLIRQNGQSPISGARIVIKSLDQTATRVPGSFTNIEGRVVTELDAAGYFISLNANNYVPLTDTITVFRDSTWNFSMTPFDPGNPPSPELCRVYGWIYDVSGNKLADVTVTAEIPHDYQPVKYNNIIITPFKKSTVSDSSGYWQIDLFPNSNLSGSNSKYLFMVEYPTGVIFKSKTAVPDSVTWQFK